MSEAGQAKISGRTGISSTGTNKDLWIYSDDGGRFVFMNSSYTQMYSKVRIGTDYSDNAPSYNLQVDGTINATSTISQAGNVVIHAGNISSQSVNYATSAGSATSSAYFPTCYIGGDQPNPQTYFSSSIGCRVAMTRYADIGMGTSWHDTLWINGYSGGDVPYMCALHFKRNGEPRFSISSQTDYSTGYGSMYEVITKYNIGSQSVNYATSAGSATNNIPKLDWQYYDNGASINDLVCGTTFYYTTHGCPTSGCVLAFSGTHNSYQTQIQADYSSGVNFYFRTKNGDNGTWNAWRRLLRADEPASSVSWSNVTGGSTPSIPMKNSENYFYHSGSSYTDYAPGLNINFKFGGSLCAGDIYSTGGSSGKWSPRIIAGDPNYNVAFLGTYNNGSIVPGVYSHNFSLNAWTSVGIGGSDIRFYANGSQYGTFNSNGFYHSSDRRLKKYIQVIDRQSLEDLFLVSNKIFKKFTWKHSNKDSYGLIAQEIQKYIPEAIFYNDEGIMSINYEIAYAKILAMILYKMSKKYK